ncbi:methyl-accepting chemotaxis protein [Shinella zoogloeoides]|uniref:methyl-accepting chemotaxis protein n=1 Tax=Shinella zoogloeoides TaxID=352475 RepID=UPI001F565DAF|nr:methyl-accepting chemotaxis protein [Shinella zoogloeoides]
MKHVPIIGKFLAIFALFGVFALAIAAYSAMQIKSVDTAYSDVLANESSAALILVNAGRALQNGRAAIADMVMAATREDTESADAEMKAIKADYAALMDKTISLLPSDTRLPALKADGLALFDKDCKGAIDLGRVALDPAGVTASQKIFNTECRPVFNGVTTRFAETANAINEGNLKLSDILTERSNSIAIISVVAVVAGFLVVLSVGYVAIRSWLARPIRGLADTMETLANGDLTATIDGTDRRDEVGVMARAVEIFKTNGLKARQLEGEAENARAQSETERARVAELDRQRAAEMSEATAGLAEGLKRLSGGDLSSQLTKPFAADFEGLRSDFNAAVSTLRETIASVAASTSAIDSGARELSQSANDLSRRTEQQAASLEETAAALDQITSNVANSTQRTEEARSVAIEANQSAQKSGMVVARAVSAMQRIEQSSSQISNIIGVIDEIAFQTNLLALNAGVEAARAGEAGKGFAVVAQEVRELAQRSAQAAKEIKDLIRTSADEVESGVKLVTETGEALKVIEMHVVSINSQLDAIAVSAKEQSVGLSEVNVAVNQMDQVTQQNAAMVEEATAASASLASEAETLRHLVSGFQYGGRDESRSAPVAASADRTSVPSPARRLVGRITSALGAGSAASKADSWEEF